VSTSATELTPADRVSTALACLALDRRVGGVLFVDLPPTLLTELAIWLNSMLADDSCEPEIITLGATHTDDDLWWLTRLVGEDVGRRFDTTSGPLIDMPNGPPRTVIVPDLARASLAVVRAAVTLVGADTAVADRYGRHEVWQPRSRWIAACARSDLGKLSPHLLDRFAVRVDSADLWPQVRDPHRLREALDADGDQSAVMNLPAPVLHGQWASQAPYPAMTSQSIDLVIATAQAASAPTRRDLALARVARALAALDSSDAVVPDHVQQAAVLLGLKLAATIWPPLPSSPPASPAGAPTDVEPTPAMPEAVVEERVSTGDEGGTTGRQQPATAILGDLTVAADLFRTGIYPEDDPDAIPEFSSLRNSWQDTRRPRSLRGHIIGTEPTRSLADIAVVPTAFEAAKFQPIRRLTSRAPGELVILGSDFRRYRRQPRPDTAVVLVLDHTCRRDWDFVTALAPYLRWAYVRRAMLSVVEFGYRGSADELRATVYRTGSVLDRRLPLSLSRAPGRATPLAHALDLSVQELRRHLRQAEVVAENSWLILVSDGRGNIPLQASQRGRVPELVTTEGVRDALLAAGALRFMPRVHKVVFFPPGLTHYTELPFDLADVMGGIVVDGAE
jgi:magnesium chelatase subunit D